MIQYVAIDDRSGIAYAQNLDKRKCWEEALNEIDKEFAGNGGVEYAMTQIELVLIEEDIE